MTDKKEYTVPDFWECSWCFYCITHDVYIQSTAGTCKACGRPIWKFNAHYISKEKIPS